MGKRGRKSVAGASDAATWADQSAMASEQQSFSNLIVALNPDLRSGPSGANGSALALPVASTAGE